MTSIYRWKGDVERDAERQVVIKTTRERLPRARARLRELHPYELPEFVVLDGAGGDAYGEWIGERHGRADGAGLSSETDLAVSRTVSGALTILEQHRQQRDDHDADRDQREVLLDDRDVAEQHSRRRGTAPPSRPRRSTL